MRLRTILASYPKSFLDALEKIGITTPEDLIFSRSIDELFYQLTPNTISYFELCQAREKVVRTLSAEGQTARSLLLNAAERKTHDARWSTGLSELDGVLHAARGGVIEIAGGKGSGKTTLALNISVSCLERVPDSMVHWIDTTGDFSPEQASRILAARGCPSSRDNTTALERLRVSLAFDSVSALDVLEALRLTLQPIHAGSDSHENVEHVLVVDPITPLFATLLDPATARGHALMTSFMRELHSLAGNYPLTILVTNDATNSHPSNPTSAFAATTLKPALGPSFTFLTDTTLWLARAQDVGLVDEAGHGNDTGGSSMNTNRSLGTPQRNLYVAEVFRSRSSPSHIWWPFIIDCNNAVRPVPQASLNTE